jgi:hypothetical protein
VRTAFRPVGLAARSMCTLVCALVPRLALSNHPWTGIDKKGRNCKRNQRPCGQLWMPLNVRGPDLFPPTRRDRRQPPPRAAPSRFPARRGSAAQRRDCSGSSPNRAARAMAEITASLTGSFRNRQMLPSVARAPALKTTCGLTPRRFAHVGFTETRSRPSPSGSTLTFLSLV